MRNYSWEYFNAQIKKLSNQNKTKSTVKAKWWSLILDFTRMSVRGMNKTKRQLRFVLMTLNIIKVTANELKIIKNHKKTISILFQ